MARRARRSEARERSPLSTPRQRGRGIGVKFAIPVSVVIAILMATLGWTLYSSASDSLDQSIDRAGIFAATALAAPDWHNADNIQRLPTLLTDKVEEVLISEKDESGQEYMVANATGINQLSITPRGEPRIEGATRIQRGIMKKDDRQIPYRSFRNSIVKPTNQMKSIAWVEIYLSEEAIEEDLAAILTKIIVFCVLGIIAGTILCFLIGGSVTRPLHALVHDMQIVAKGNLAHRTKVRSRDEIGVLATTFDEMAAGLQEAVQLKEDLSSKEHQEHIAQEIQEKLFPSTLPEIAGCRVDAVFEPAGDIARDLFDFVEVAPGKTGLIVLSASGSGVPAAIVLAMARSVFRATASGIASPAEALRRINALFSPDLRRGMYVTAIYAIYTEKTGELLVASAGHKMPLLHFSRERDALARVHPGGIAMGLDKGPVFDKSMEEAKVALGDGDAAVLGSAGVVELVLKSGEPIGEQRFFKAVLTVTKTESAEIAQNVVQKVDANLAEDAGDFDVTLVSLRRS